MVAVHFPNNGEGGTRGATVGVRVSGLNNASTEMSTTPSQPSASTAPHRASGLAEAAPAHHRNMMFVTQQ